MAFTDKYPDSDGESNATSEADPKQIENFVEERNRLQEEVRLHELTLPEDYALLYKEQPIIIGKHHKRYPVVRKVDGQGSDMEWIPVKIPKEASESQPSARVDVFLIECGRTFTKCEMKDESGRLHFILRIKDGSDKVTLQNKGDQSLSAVIKVKAGTQAGKDIYSSETIILEPGCWEVFVEVVEKGKLVRKFTEIKIEAAAAKAAEEAKTAARQDSGLW